MLIWNLTLRWLPASAWNQNPSSGKPWTLQVHIWVQSDSSGPFPAEANWEACGMPGRQTTDLYCTLAPLAIVLMGWSSWETIWLLLTSILFSYNADCAEAWSCQQSASSVISRQEKWSDICWEWMGMGVFLKYKATTKICMESILQSIPSAPLEDTP